MTTTLVAKASVGDQGALNADLKPSLSEVWIDRDLGWLDFNERVLAEALDDRTPLLERAKFLAIFTSNLDEFFMKRVAALRRSNSPGAVDLRSSLRAKLLPMLRTQADYFRTRLVPDLARHNIYLRYWSELTPEQRKEAEDFFDNQVSLALTPLVINPKESFPFLSNLSTQLIFILEDPITSQRMFGRVKIPSNLRQWVRLTADVGSADFVFVRLDEIIRASLSKLYSGMTLSGITLVRLSRQIETSDDDDQDVALSEQIRQAIRNRRFQPVVRLEFDQNADESVKQMLREHFRLSEEFLYEASDELDYTNLFEIAALDVSSLKDTPWAPVTPPALRDGLLTCDLNLTHDVTWLFHYLTGHSDRPDCHSLLVAPKTMRPRFLELIEREIGIVRNGGSGRIIAKMNQLEDPEIIEALIEASTAGVSIDLIIRGFCCLRPGIPGRTENIRVRSIIGRFLEHSRIYYFGGGASNPADGEFFIGSADWMFRNLSRRIEVVTPIVDPDAKQRLWEVLNINLQDRRQAWILGPEGTYSRPRHGDLDSRDALGSQAELMALASR